MRAILGLLLALAVADVLWIGSLRGAFRDPAATVWETADAKEYRAVAEWLAGATDLPVTASERRPVLYPLFLASVGWSGAGTIIVLQLGMYLASGLLLWRVLRRRAGDVAAVLGAAVFFGHPSLAAMVHDGHAEILVVFFWCVLLTRLDRSDWLSPRAAGTTTFLLSLLTITKPLYQLHLALFVALVLTSWLRRPGPWRPRVAALLLGVTPVVLQAGLMWTLHGRPFLSTISADTLRDYFYPKLYVRTGGAASIEAAQRAVLDWPAGTGRDLVLAQPQAALATFWDTLLWDNLSQGSVHLPAEGSWRTCSGAINLWAARLHALMAPFVLFCLWRSRDLRVAFAWVSAGLVILTSGISFWQGDRLIIVALPLWLFTYVVVLSWLAARLRARWSAGPPASGATER